MEEPSSSIPPPEEESPELDARRIAQWATLRRAAYRSRSYCIVAVIGCLVGSVQLIFEAILRRRAGHSIIATILYLIAAAAFLIIAAFCARTAVAYHRQAKESSLPNPKTPPDFSTLSNGSQIVQNLNQM